MELPYIEETITTIIRKYNPKYGDNKICKCGHQYYRHFDTYDNMEPVGCKYCECYEFESQIEIEDRNLMLQKERERKYPKTLEDFRKRLPDAENYCYTCNGARDKWWAYLMGCGAEDLVAKFEFPSKEAIVQFYKDNGIERCFGI